MTQILMAGTSGIGTGIMVIMNITGMIIETVKTMISKTIVNLTSIYMMKNI